MAKNITKNLKLKAQLEDQKLKKQLQQLKKELGSFDIGGSTLRDFDKSAKLLNEAANSLKQAMAGIGKGSFGDKAGGFSAARKTADDTKRSKEIKTIVEEITKNTTNKTQQIFDPQRGKYTSLAPGQVYDKELGKRFKKEIHHEEAKAKFQEKQILKQQQKSDMHAKRKLKEEAKAKAMERNKDLGAAKDMIAAVGSRTGIGLPMARQVAQVAGNSAPGLLGKAGGLLRGGGSAIAGALGTGGMIAGGAVAGLIGAPLLAGGIYNSYMNQDRVARSQRAQHEQGGALSNIQGQGLQGLLEDASRREGSSGFSGFGGGISQSADDLFSFSPARWFRALSGESYGQGKIQAGANEAQAVQDEMALTNASLGTAKGLRGARLANMRGGTSSEMITALQQLGVEEGFSLGETNEQLGTAKSVLGNFGATNLPMMQKMLQRTGTSIEAQAGSIDTLTGATRGGSFHESVQKNVEILKKGVAAGLDFSRSGKFLQTTADFVKNNMGFGQVNVDRISSRLADSAAGFAGGGDVSEANLRQAQQLEQMLTKESTAKSGFAGIGNVTSLQGVYGDSLDTGKMIAGMNISSNATAEDVMKIMGGTKEQAEEFLKQRRGAKDIGLKAAGIDPSSALGIGLSAEGRGITSESQLGINMAKGGKAGAMPANLDGGRPLGPELSSAVVEGRNQQAAFVTGMKVMSVETEKVNSNLNEFSAKLQTAIDRLEQYSRVIDNER